LAGPSSGRNLLLALKTNFSKGKAVVPLVALIFLTNL